LELAFVEIEAFRLPERPAGRQAEPFEIVADRVVELGGRALTIGVVDPQDERPVIPAREKEVVERRSDIADMESPGRRRRESGNDAHPGSFVLGPVWKKLLIG